MDEVDDAVQQACREMGASLREMDAALKGKGVEVSFTVKRHDSGEWAVFATADMPETTLQ